MTVPEEGSLRVLALLLLTAGLVAGSVLPGLTPSLTDPAHGETPSEAPPETPPLDSPEAAMEMKGLGAAPTPASALARVADKRDAPEAPPLPEVEGEDPLPDALRTLARSGESPDDAPLQDPATQQALDRAGRLPQDLQRDLALVVLAVAEARDLQAEAVADLSPAQRRALASGDLTPEQARSIRADVDMGKSLQAARLVDAAVREARPGLDQWSEVMDIPATRDRGVAAPGTPPTPADQATDLLGSLGTPTTPEAMIESSAHLRGFDASVPPMAPALENATLRELLVTAYLMMGVPKSAATASSVSASSGLDPDIRETAAVGLRHYLHGLLLQRQALADLTPAERAALSAAGPQALSGGGGLGPLYAEDVGPVDLALLRSAVEKVDQRRLHQSAAALARSSTALQEQAPEPVGNALSDVDCPQDARGVGNVTAAGISPVRTDRPVSCRVGDLTVSLGLTDDTAVHLGVDTDGDGEDDFVDETVGRGTGVRLHWNPDTAQVTVYQDTNDNDKAEPHEVEYRNEPLRDRDNNVAFVDPYGFFVVGAHGPTVFDDRYADVQVPPDPRDQRVRAVRESSESNLPPLARQFIDDEGSGIVIPSAIFGDFCPGEDCTFDSRLVDDTAWRTGHHPVNVSVNPNGTHILTVDRGGDSLYTQNVGGYFRMFRTIGNYQADQNLTVAGFDTGIDSLTFQLFLNRLPAASIDLGGDDVYEPDMDDFLYENNRTIGTGLIGSAGVAVDVGGDDVYRAENTSLAFGAAAGLGLVADLGGDDTFVSRNATLGTGFGIGTGLFLSAGGNDTYKGGAFTQGTGVSGDSVGLFVDAGDGEDTYETTMDLGRIPAFSDPQGNMNHTMVSQGAAENGGTGIMVDGGGDDTYLKPREPPTEPSRAQGVSFGRPCPFAATFCSQLPAYAGFPGILADLGGDDEGLRRTGSIEHSRLGTVGIGPHFTGEGYTAENGHRLPTGYVIDADVRDDPRLSGDGYVFAPGDVTWDTSQDPVRQKNFTLTVPGLLAVGDHRETNWTESYVVGVDLGSDDTYHTRPGSAVLVPGTSPAGDSLSEPHSGPPTVGGKEYRPRLVSFHLDLGGSDTYRAHDGPGTPSARALGTGMGGVGLAYDLGGGDGADSYEAGTRALGHGELGVGVFFDETGSDTYRLRSESHPGRGLGFGSLGGVGVFVDARGFDTYEAEALSAGAYEFQYEAASRDRVEAAEGSGFEVGAGVFLDGDGVDEYDVPSAALGHVGGDPLVIEARRNLSTTPMAAVFVDEGFENDTYPDVHADAGRGNNDFWERTQFGRGFDNLDYYMHYQVVWADNGNATARRAASLLLSPSARIVGPPFPSRDGGSVQVGTSGAQGRALTVLNGTASVTVNASYGGNRSLLLNTRSLAMAPFREDAPGPGDVLEELPDPCAILEAADRECPPEVPNPTDFPGPQELGHYGVGYASATYYSLQNLFKAEGPRGQDGPSKEHQDETQRGADMFVKPVTGRPAQFPSPRVLGEFTCAVTAELDVNCRQTIPIPIFPDRTVDPRDTPADRAYCGLLSMPCDENVVNGPRSKSLQNLGIVYDPLDATGGTDVTQFWVVGMLDGSHPLSPGVNDEANDTFDCGDAAVDANSEACPFAPSTQASQAGPSSGGSAAGDGSSHGPTARDRWVAAHSLLVSKALAAGVSGGDVVDEPVDRALDHLVSTPAQRETSGHSREPGERGPASPADCSPSLAQAGPEEVDASPWVTCVIRASFHQTIERADRAREECRAASGNADDASCGELPDVVNPPGGGRFVRTVELVADGKQVVEHYAGNGSQNQFTLTWDTAALDDTGRYRWEDGNHTLRARVFYEGDPDGDGEYEGRPNRWPGSPASDPGHADSRNRTRDPYGFYPGTDRITVQTDNPPRVYEIVNATDFNPAAVDGDCQESPLNCHLTYDAVISEDARVSAEIEAVADEDGSPSRRSYRADSASVTEEGDPFTVTATWDPSEGSPPPDGLYRVNLTMREDDDTQPDVSTWNTTPFYATSDPPETLASPLATDGGYSGLDHVTVVRYENGTVNTTAETPWSLPVTAQLAPDEPPLRSPVDSFDLYRRVYNPQANPGVSEFEAADAPCPGEPVEKPSSAADGNVTWCRVAQDVDGDTTAMNITKVGPLGKAPLEDRRIYLVARATDAAGNEESHPFPDVGPDLGTGEPEGKTYVDLTRPSSFLSVSGRDTNRTRVEVEYEVQGGPVRDVDVAWDLAPNASAAGSDPKELPASLFRDDQSFVWSADAVGVSPDHGDRLFLLMRATDAAGNREAKETSTLPTPVRFDFQEPGISGNVTARSLPQSIGFEWTSSEELRNASARVWPAGSPGDAEPLNVTGTPSVHEALATGLRQATSYRLEVSMTDKAGNRNTILVDRTFQTRQVIRIDPVAPAAGDVVSGDAVVSWIARNVTEDPLVHYNISLAPDAGPCSIPLQEVTFFEGEPAPREVTFDTDRFPSVQAAQVCLEANNTLNQDDPIVTRIPRNGTFVLDNAAPTTNLTVSGPGTGDWVRGRATVELNATDDSPGSVTTRYVLDGGEPQVYDGPFTVADDGVHEVTYWSEDTVGREEEKKTSEVLVDGTPPEGNLTLDGGASRTDSTEVTVGVNGSDAVSGVADVVIRSSDGRHRRVPGSLLAGGAIELPWTLASGDGSKTVRVVLWDEAGNRLTLRRAITLDTTAPEIERGAAEEVGFTQAAIRWTTDEPASAEVLYKEEDSPAFQNSVVVDDAAVQHTAVLRNLTPATTYEVKIVAEDPLGNAGGRTLGFETAADTTPPSRVEGLEARVLDSGFVELNWTEAFDEVGVASYMVTRSENGSYVSVAETPRTVILDDGAPAGETVSYKVQAVDVGGNAGPASPPIEVTVETAPEFLEAGVTPERGTSEDLYTFRAVVRDRDGDDLEHVRVVVDGEPRPMTPSGAGEVEDGIAYTLETALDATTLSEGTHRYGFHVSDGTHTTRLPEEGARSGPVVLEPGSGDADVAGFGAVQRAVPVVGPALLLLSGAAVAVLARRRWSP